MPTDQIGNPLAKGDAVAVKVGTEMLTATIVDIKEPSVLAPGKDAMVIPGQLQLMIPLTVMFNPRNPVCGGVIKIVKPVNWDTKPS